MLVLNGYFDASGNHKGSGAVAVAGFLARAPDWVEFSARWQLALSECGLSEAGFHMTDFANGAPPYDTWTDEQKRQRLARLLTIITERKATSFGIVVRRHEFDECLSDRAHKICGDVYGLAVIACFMEIGNLIHDIDVDAWDSYVFEAGDEGSGQVLRAFKHNIKDLVQKERMRLLSLRFEPKDKFLPLQAADILAYELYRDAARKMGSHSRPARYPLSQLRQLPNRWHWMSRDNLKQFSEVLELRADLEDSGRLSVGCQRFWTVLEAHETEEKWSGRCSFRGVESPPGTGQRVLRTEHRSPTSRKRCRRQLSSDAGSTIRQSRKPLKWEPLHPDLFDQQVSHYR